MKVSLHPAQAAANLSRPATIPSRSDTVLVSETVYDEAGMVWKETDPADTENRTEYDDAGRTVKTIENYVDGTPSADTDKTTEFAYTADSQLKTLTAKNKDNRARLNEEIINGFAANFSKAQASGFLRMRDWRALWRYWSRREGGRSSTSPSMKPAFF